MNITFSPNLNNVKQVSFTAVPQTQVATKNSKIPDRFEKQSFDECFHLVKNANGQVKSVVFDKPIKIQKAFEILAKTKNKLLEYELLEKFHTQSQLITLSCLTTLNKKIKDTKVKSLYGMGSYSLAFETTNGDILKISETNQFYNNRKPAWFDLPIREKGRLSEDYYYYFEEKVDQLSPTQDELRDFVKEIKKSGYKIHDYLMHYTGKNVNIDNETIKAEQFGRAKDGKLYLIDAGCVHEEPKSFWDIKRLKNTLFKWGKKEY